MAKTGRDPVLQEVLRYVELGEADRSRLQDLGARLAPELSEIAERFYLRLAAHPRAAAVLHGPDQIRRLRVTLVDWMRSGLLGPYDDAFYDKRSRIGRKHVSIGLPQEYMFTAMNVIRGEYDERIARLYEPDQARLVARSVDKLLDVELALMLRHYQLDSEARLVTRVKAPQTDRVTALQTLSAGLAHELRNPLNSAKLQLELLERRLRRDRVDPKLLEPVDLVQHELERLTRLLAEFLSFARPPPLVLGDHDIVALAQDVVAVERAAAQARGAMLEAGGTASLYAQVDPHKVRQIIQNLVHNAIEAVAPGGHVVVTVGADDAEIHVTVADDGPGIPEEIQRRVYEPFFTTKEAGTGLGLSIVHGMVTLHGGAISIDSTPQGTQFHVVLPRRVAAAGTADS
jgi:signal transduction histidine kinase